MGDAAGIFGGGEGAYCGTDFRRALRRQPHGCNRGRRGRQYSELLERALTFSPETLKPDRARYAFLLNEKGGAKDDLMTFRLNEERFILVVNASNREKDLNWLKDIGRDFKPY